MTVERPSQLTLGQNVNKPIPQNVKQLAPGQSKKTEAGEYSSALQWLNKVSYSELDIKCATETAFNDVTTAENNNKVC